MTKPYIASPNGQTHCLTLVPVGKETLAERLRRLREAAGLTASALAVKVGVGEYAIRKIEYGTSKQPGFTVGLRIAEVLNVSPKYLAFGREGSTLPDSPDDRLAELEGKFALLAAIPGQVAALAEALGPVLERAQADDTLKRPAKQTRRTA